LPQSGAAARGPPCGSGSGTPDPLMRSCPIEVRHISIEHPLELLLVEDQEVVEAFFSHTPQEAFADRIGPGSVIRGGENLNGTCHSHTSKTGSKFAVVITHQILRCLPVGRRFSQLVRHPEIGRRSCHANMDHLSCFELDEEEREERPKKEIVHLQEIAGPESRRVIVQKGCPPLSSWLRWANSSDVLLDGPLADTNAEFQEFPPHPFSTPQSILNCHLPD
jgi:hypothetical protein